MHFTYPRVYSTLLLGMSRICVKQEFASCGVVFPLEPLLGEHFLPWLGMNRCARCTLHTLESTCHCFWVCLELVVSKVEGFDTCGVLSLLEPLIGKLFWLGERC